MEKEFVTYRDRDGNIVTLKKKPMSQQKERQIRRSGWTRLTERVLYLPRRIGEIK